MKKYIFTLTLILLGGCSLTPDYKRPEMAMPENFKEISKLWEIAKPSDDLPKGDWWKEFNDPILNNLVSKINSNNFQLMAAVSRYDSARAYLDANSASLLPQVGLFGTATSNRQSIDRPLRGAKQPDFYPTNTVGAQANYELDIWGRVRSQVNSASALAEAAKADLETVRLLLESELINNYFALRSADSQLDIFDDNIKTYQKQVSVIEYRYKEGVVGGADLYRVQTLLENEQIKRSTLVVKRAQYEHAIALLVGEPASSFNLAKGSISTITLPKIALQIPSTLLQRRPDIAAAERRVAASNESIGVAKSAFFPTISLSAIGGYQNAGNNSLISAPTQFWSIGPMAFFTIFDGGLRSAVVNQAVAKNSETIAVYKNTVLSAVKEVEDVLVDMKNRETSLVHVDNALASSNKSYGISVARYNEGVANYLEIVDAALQKSQSELLKVDYQSQLLIDRVLLVKALGGYWQ